MVPMFGRKKQRRKAELQLILLRADDEVLLACPLAEYVLPEKVVLALSTEYFDDPEPCSIHRSAVHKRAMLELMDFCPAGQTAAVASLPAAMRAWFPADTSAVRISEGM